MSVGPDGWFPATRRAIVDGDIVAHSCAWVGDKAPSFKASLAAAREMMFNFREALEIEEATIYLTGPGNFRKELTDTYKANRKDKPLPRYLNHVKKYLIKHWGAEETVGIEADDMISIHAYENPTKIVCSTDKDLDQIQGWHYNWRKFSVYYVTPLSRS